MSTCDHPKMDCGGVLLDEGLFILGRLIQDHRGIAISDGCQGEDSKAPAYVICPKIEDGLELMTHIAHLTDYTLGDNMAMLITPPGADIQPHAKVIWIPEATSLLVRKWA